MNKIPAITLEEWDAIAENPKALRAIDLIRPDTALANGRAMQKMRKEGKTDWVPTPRNNRVAKQGAREMSRRRKQMLRDHPDFAII